MLKVADNITAQATKESEKMEKNHSLFFNRRETIKYFSDSLKVALHKGGYNTSLSVRFEKSDAVAYTDGKTVVLNYGHAFFDGLPLVDHVLCLLGVAAHEQAHIRYTQFDKLKSDVESFEKGIIPDVPNVMGNIKLEKALDSFKKALTDKTKTQILIHLFHSIHNVVEDGYIENLFLNEYNGELADALCAVREYQFYKGHTITEVIEATACQPQWAVYQNLMLSYAKYGKFLCNKLSDLDCPQVKRMIPVLPLVDKYIDMPKGCPKEKTSVIIEIMLTIWDVIEEWLSTQEAMNEIMKQLAKMMESEGSDGQTTIMPINGKSMMSDDDEDGESSSNNENSQSSKNSKAKSARNGNAEKTKENLQKMDSQSADGQDKDNSKKDAQGNKDGQDKNNNGQDKDGQGNSTSTSPKKIKPQADPNKHMAENSDNMGEEAICDVLRDEAGRIDNSCQGMNEDTGDGTIEHRNINPGGYEGAASDIINLINNISRDSALTSLENDKINADQSEASNYKLSGIHSNVNFRINRISSVSEGLIDNYNKVSADLMPISKILQRKLKKELKERAREEVLRSQLTGRKLMRNSLYKIDGKIWSTKKLPSPTNLSLGILIDESGSMSGYDRATSARAAAIVLEDFCRGLNIPVCIYGHTSGQTRNNTVDLYNYVSFDNVDGKDKYRLMDISARCGNRDGAALKFVGDKLLKRQEDNKLLIIISDGQPADSGYYGQEAEDDLRNIKKQLNRAGVVLFAAAIGADKENIHRIYGDGFMDISDLNELPKVLCKLVSRFLK